MTDAIKGFGRCALMSIMFCVYFPGVVVCFFVHGILEGCKIGWELWKVASRWAVDP